MAKQNDVDSIINKIDEHLDKAPVLIDKSIFPNDSFQLPCQLIPSHEDNLHHILWDFFENFGECEGEVEFECGYLFSLPLDYKRYLCNGSVSDWLKIRFDERKERLSDNAKIFQKDDKTWEVGSRKKKYKIEDTGTELKISGGKRRIDLVCRAKKDNDNEIIIGIEVKSKGFNPTNLQIQLSRYINSERFDLIFTAFFQRGGDETSNYVEDNRIGTLYYHPFGELILDKIPTPIKRTKPLDRKKEYTKEIAVKHAIWKYFRDEGYFVSVESLLPSLIVFEPAQSKSYFGPVPSFRDRKTYFASKNRDRIDFTICKSKTLKDLQNYSFDSDIIGIECKGLRFDKKKTAEQLKEYLHSGDITKLFLAVPDNAKKRAEKLINEDLKNEVGLLTVLDDGKVKRIIDAQQRQIPCPTEDDDFDKKSFRFTNKCLERLKRRWLSSRNPYY